MERPVWKPNVTEDLSNSEIQLYLELSTSACIRGGGHHLERAHQVLYQSNGDITKAVEHLLSTPPDYAIWTDDEIQKFERLLAIHGKEFNSISRDIKTKSRSECIEFYYLCKKTSPQRQKKLFQRQEQKPLQPQQMNTCKSEGDLQDQQFPCKVCGRVFEKIKSRSAHMKRHKNGR